MTLRPAVYGGTMTLPSVVAGGLLVWCLVMVAGEMLTLGAHWFGYFNLALAVLVAYLVGKGNHDLPA